MRNTTLVALLLAGLSAGCVTRRYVITSDPPGAMVFRDGQPIGITPVEEEFVYYGFHDFRLVKDGYQTLDEHVNIPAPWYEWPGIDFISENVVIQKIHDIHRLCFRLVPLEQVRHDDIRRAAEDLRQRGKALQPRPAPPDPRRPAVPGGPLVPAPGAVPPPGAPLPPPLPPPGLPGQAPAGAPALPSVPGGFNGPSPSLR
jgi:hypothetical protein